MMHPGHETVSDLMARDGYRNQAICNADASSRTKIAMIINSKFIQGKNGHVYETNAISDPILGMSDYDPFLPVSVIIGDQEGLFQAYTRACVAYAWMNKEVFCAAFINGGKPLRFFEGWLVNLPPFIDIRQFHANVWNGKRNWNLNEDDAPSILITKTCAIIQDDGLETLHAISSSSPYAMHIGYQKQLFMLTTSNDKAVMGWHCFNPKFFVEMPYFDIMGIPNNESLFIDYLFTDYVITRRNLCREAEFDVVE